MDDQLAKRSNEQLTISGRSALCLKKMLYLACQATGRDLMPGEERLWELALAGKSSEQIEEGFKDFFSEPKTDVFFPKPGEILDCIQRTGFRRGQERQWKQTAKDCDENRKARESGTTTSWGTIMANAKRWVAEHAMPTPSLNLTGKDFAPLVITEQRRKQLHEQARELQKKYSTGNRPR